MSEAEEGAATGSITAPDQQEGKLMPYPLIGGMFAPQSSDSVRNAFINETMGMLPLE